MVLAAALFTHWHKVWPHLNFSHGFQRCRTGRRYCGKAFHTYLKTIEKTHENGWKFRFLLKAANQSAPPTTTSAVASFHIGLRWPPWLRGRRESACQQSFEPWLLLFPPPITSLPWCYYTVPLLSRQFCLYYNKSSLSHPINNFHLAHLRSQLHMHTASCSIAMLSFSQQLLRLLACSG